MAGLTKVAAGGVADNAVTADSFADNSINGDHLNHSTALPDGVTATTQSASDDSTKVATTAYVDNAVGGISADKITEGNTTVECVDAGTGHIAFDTDGAEKARIDTSGRLLIGTNSPRVNGYNSTSGQETKLQIEGTDYGSSSLSIVRNSDNAIDGALLLGKTRGSAALSNAALSLDDYIGRISFQGSDGSGLVEGATIRARITTNCSNNDMPTSLLFSTTADGASSPTERMRITHAGKIGIGTTSPVHSVNISNGTVNGMLHADGSSNFGIGAYSNHSLAFYSNDTERARFNQYGNLLIGSTVQDNDNIAGTGYPNIVQINGSGDGEGLRVANTQPSRIDIIRDVDETSVTDGMDLGFLSFGAGAGTSVQRAAVWAKASFSNGGTQKRGGQLLLQTSPDNSAGPATRMTIKNDGNISIEDGNLEFASGHGIDFSATSGTGTSELLDDYEEGTWTPRLNGWTGSAYTNVSNTTNAEPGHYIKIGREVTVFIRYQWSSMPVANGNPLYIYDLPFNVTNDHHSAGSMARIGGISDVEKLRIYKYTGSTNMFYIQTAGASNLSGMNGNNGEFIATITYMASA